MGAGVKALDVQGAGAHNTLAILILLHTQGVRKFADNTGTKSGVQFVEATGKLQCILGPSGVWLGTLDRALIAIHIGFLEGTFTLAVDSVPPPEIQIVCREEGLMMMASET